MTALAPQTNLTERFAPVFAQIAAGALEREADRRLPYEEVEALRAAGFGRLRVPRSHGGFGVSIREYVDLLIGLARADSNLPQLLRGHAGFVEGRLVHLHADVRDRWLWRVADGVIVGNAQSEVGNRSFWEHITRVAEDPQGGWRLRGRKFYSTGSLFADWLQTTATLDEDRSANVLVPASAAGVSRIDDWDGFGQRLTGSGTTIFDDVEVHVEDVEIYDNPVAADSYLPAFFQLVHLATLSGVAERALDETVAFVRQRTRNLANPAYSTPKDDPAVQQVVGGLQGKVTAARAATLIAAEAVDRTSNAQQAGIATQADFDASDVAVYAAQGAVVDLVLAVTSDLFEVGGASAVTQGFLLDRHWRNARTLASHNPVIYRDRIVGAYLLDGTSPSASYQRSWEDVRGREGS